jgi:uncharacterized damage-inducible protein DinB
MNALSGEDLLAWVDETSEGWRTLLEKHPEALLLPCDVRETHSVAELLQHIVAVELRFAERLSGLPETAYEQIPFGTAAELYATHDQAMELLHALLANSERDWDGVISFATRSAGNLKATRRVVFVHLLMHSIRHYAQLATLVRQHGIKPDFLMDYLFMRADS